jgi:hypothetical protein
MMVSQTWESAGNGDGDDDQDDHFYTEAWFLRKSRAVNIVGLLNDSLSCQML